jgi:glycosyltransferase involved in cell wall biosynthesis
MILLEHSTYDEDTVGANLGAPEYSYWFVRKAFRRILERFGVLMPVTNPERDADRIYRSAQAHGIECALLTFNPPQYTPTELACPTIPVFAWEFDTIPNESWNANPREDWRYVFERIDTAITHSSASVQAVRDAMGPDYPVWSIPAPVFQGKARHVASARGWQPPVELVLRGAVGIDATAVDLSLFEATRSVDEGARALRLLRRAASDPSQPPQTLTLSGVVYTTVLNPADGRKNWNDLAAGFVWAFRDTPDATLVLKLTHADMVEGVLIVLQHLAKLKPFKCKILVVHGLLDDEAYDGLIAATSYTVNTANGEGQCLPLMEYMSAGRPAVAPRHTAMIDYVSDDNAFVVASRPRPTFWPHDERHAIRCTRNEVVFVDLVRQFRESYRVAREDPARYAAMSAAAVTALEAFCSDEVVTARLAEVLSRQGLSPKIVPLRSGQPLVAKSAQGATA